MGYPFSIFVLWAAAAKWEEELVRVTLHNRRLSTSDGRNVIPSIQNGPTLQKYRSWAHKSRRDLEFGPLEETRQARCAQHR